MTGNRTRGFRRKRQPPIRALLFSQAIYSSVYLLKRTFVNRLRADIALQPVEKVLQSLTRSLEPRESLTDGFVKSVSLCSSCQLSD